MSFEQTVAYYGAPAICGIKPASLFSVKKDFVHTASDKVERWNKSLAKKERHLELVKCKNGISLMFIYDKELLKKTLGGKQEQLYLASKNYHTEKGFEFILAEMLSRLEEGKKFPHEIGLFLGYPLEDVLGFECNCGRCSRYTGCWKVYTSNLDEAIEKMRLYKECSKRCSSLFEQGVDIAELADK